MDAVCKLIPFIEQRKDGVVPTLVLQVDQFGLLHAPFAAARAYFAEYLAPHRIESLVHVEKGKKLERMELSTLVPNRPEIECG